MQKLNHPNDPTKRELRLMVELAQQPPVTRVPQGRKAYKIGIRGWYNLASDGPMPNPKYTFPKVS